MHVYEIDLDADLGKVCPEADRLIQSVNDELATFGHSGRIAGRLTIGRMTVCTPEPLTDEGLEMLKKTTQEVVAERLPSLNLSVGEIRCQPGKSRSQSDSK